MGSQGACVGLVVGRSAVDVPTCLSDHVTSMNACTTPAATAVPLAGAGAGAERAAAAAAGAITSTLHAGSAPR